MLKFGLINGRLSKAKNLGVNYQNIRDTVDVMAVNAQLHINASLGSSIKTAISKVIFRELALRGYDLTKLHTKTIMIFKITFYRQAIHCQINAKSVRQIMQKVFCKSRPEDRTYSIKHGGRLQKGVLLLLLASVGSSHFTP